MNICICDDNVEHSNYIHLCVQNFFLEKSLSDYSLYQLKPEELQNSLINRDFPYTISILDIELGSMNGIYVASKINQINPNCKIIFITNFDSYQEDVYDAIHCDFVKKTQLPNRLYSALDRVLIKHLLFPNHSLKISIQGKTIYLLYYDIIYFEQEKHRTHIYTQNGAKHTHNNPLSFFISSLKDAPQFIQTHKSYLINIQCLTEFSSSEVTLNFSIKIPISRTYCKLTKTALTNYTKNFLS